MWHRLSAGPRSWLEARAKVIRRTYWTAFVQVHAGSVGKGLRVNGRTFVTSSVHIGSNCHFNGMHVHGGARVDIGDNFHSAGRLLVITINHNYETGTALPYDREIIEKPVSIGANVWIGDSVIVTPGTQIGEGAVIGAGAVVSGTIEPLAVVGGNPARVLKHRNADHYNELKSAGRFI